MQKKKWSASMIFMIVMGILVQGIFMLPWMSMDGEKTNAPAYLLRVLTGEAEMETIGIIQLGLLVVAQLSSLVCTIIVFLKKQIKNVLYIVSLSTATATAFIYTEGPMWQSTDIFTNIYPFIVMCILTVILVVGKLTEVWKEHVAEYQIQKQREEEIKQEREERLKFEGKYSTAFLRVIWKNFRYNWRTYRIFAVVGTFSVSLIFAGFGMWEVLKDCHANENLALGQGLGTILCAPGGARR